MPKGDPVYMITTIHNYRSHNDDRFNYHEQNHAATADSDYYYSNNIVCTIARMMFTMPLVRKRGTAINLRSN